jgi:hypothetical protein
VEAHFSFTWFVTSHRLDFFGRFDCSSCFHLQGYCFNLVLNHSVLNTYASYFYGTSAFTYTKIPKIALISELKGKGVQVWQREWDGWTSEDITTCFPTVSYRWGSPYNRPQRAQRGSTNIDLHMLDLGARRGWMVSITPRPFYPQERPGTHCTGVWVGPRAGLDMCEKSRPHRTVQPVASHYTDWANRPTV